MLFSQTEFAAFLGLVLGLVLLARTARARRLVLLGASWWFYAHWDWRFLGLLIGVTAVSWLAGILLARAQEPRERRLITGLSVGTCVASLAVFKYADFFLDSLAALLAPLGVHVGTLGILLPVGISFFTFHALSYILDVSRGIALPCRSFTDHALYVGFFPQLVAGPIVRAADFLPQFAEDRRPTWARARAGLARFSVGFFKKVFIADRLAPFVDGVFAAPGLHDTPTTWLALLAYAVQIYGDFAGYSDMAIGLAGLFGYDLRENFDFPYLALTPADFWRRWHISLSTWLRDYLYVPLGGNRRGATRTQVNLLLTMLLGGLWHGASWTFVAWGALHGTALASLKALGRPVTEASPALVRAASRVLTLGIVLGGWVLFRAATLEDAGEVFRSLMPGSGGLHWIPPFALLAVGLTALLTTLEGVLPAGSRLRHALTLPPTAPWAPWVMLALIFIAIAFHPSGFQPFIYFRF